MKRTIGKLRGLQQCTSPRGTFTCLALDHRQNLRKANPVFINNADLARFKLDVTAALADLSTSVLLDPEVSAAQAIAVGALPGSSAFVVALESTGYSGAASARQSQILPGWTVEKAKRMGASMIKLLVYYHPDSSTAHDIEAFVQQVADKCSRYDLSIMLEPLSYSLDAAKKLSSAEKRYVVTETARRLVGPGIDVLKAEFPVDPAEDPDESAWIEACAEVSSASPAPWIVLSAAVNFELYLRQVETACRAGASGAAAGRAIWQEAISLDGEPRLEFLRTTGRQRLSRLSALCSDYGKPISDFFTADAPFDWYKNY
ncbi:MAG: tagatose 1,6-diphosphate aldolase [Anaerolineales bacterium]